MAVWEAFYKKNINSYAPKRKPANTDSAKIDVDVTVYCSWSQHADGRCAAVNSVDNFKGIEVMFAACGSMGGLLQGKYKLIWSMT